MIRVTKLTTTGSYDNLNRLTQIRNLDSGLGTLDSRSSDCNSANQRTKRTDADGSYWDYTYDTLGQLTSGSRKWPDGSAVAGQQYGYAYDDIGNRATNHANGRESTYTANGLNQYMQRTVPGYVWELGSATNAATVTINNQPTSRHGEYFSKELAVNNAASAIYTQLTTVAVLKNAGSNEMDIVASATGKLFVAQSPEAFSYDADGNTLSDGRWTNMLWDAENRLVSLETATAAVTAGAPRQKLEFGYDANFRRTSKKVYAWSGSAWQLASELRYVYDGWNPLAELDASNGVVRSYVWGLDLSGTMQGAGGVGGLLAASLGTNGTHFIAYDGNGNVSALVDTATGAVSGNVEYGPFGEPVRVTGAAAIACPIRFSTKYQDVETGWLNYTFRLYEPSTGRWRSRDPSGEIAVSLYAAFFNSPANFVDRDGRDNYSAGGGVVPFAVPRPSSGPPQLGGSWEMFWYLYFGNHQQDTTVSSDLVQQLLEYVQKTHGAIFDDHIKKELACGKAGRYFKLHRDNSFNFRERPNFFGAHMGNWQVRIAADCIWECEAHDAQCCCICAAACNLAIYISKTYTLVNAPEFNPANSGLGVKILNLGAVITQGESRPMYFGSGHSSLSYGFEHRVCD